jgi:cation:H+ antiporter
VDLLLLLVAFVVILAGAELFTNGIEWFGRKLELGEGAVGSVLAAVGTALPETMIPVIAILFGADAEAHSVGVGAVLGAPFMLGTLAMAVTGVVVLLAARRRTAGDRLVIRPAVVAHDVRTFVLAYAAAVSLALHPAGLNWPRAAGAIVLVGVYVWYARRHFGSGADADAEEPRPLRFHGLERPHRRLEGLEPRVRIVLAQVLVALVVVILGATMFVRSVESIGAGLGLDGILLALLVAPIATELPEAVNAVIWIRQGKDTLAIGNITGAMVFQATIPTAIALLFAPEVWVLAGRSVVAFASVPVVFVSVALIAVPMVRRGGLTGRALLGGGVFYVGYLAFVGLSAGGVLPIG